MTTPTPINMEALKEYVIQQLGKGTRENDLLLDICGRTNIPWEDARRLVNRIREEDAQRIAERQLPWSIFLALVIGIGGLALLAGSIYFLVSLLDMSTQLAQQGLGTGDLISQGSEAYSVFQAVTSRLPVYLGMLVTGLAMLMGSAIGMRNTWRTMINWLGDHI